MNNFTLIDYWQLFLRGRWVIVGAICLCASIAAALCYALPKAYRSSTLILIEDQKVPEDYVKAVVAGTIGERLTTIQQQVMSRTLLSAIIEEFKLYANELSSEGLESVIDKVRRGIKVEMVGGTGGRGVEAFSISFEHQDPRTAMAVTAKLANAFISENAKAREQLAEGTSEFLEQELQLAKQRLEEKEQTIRDFKARHMGVLPQQMEANLRTLDRLQNDEIAATETYNQLTGRLGLIEKTISEYEATGKTGASVAAGSGGPDPLVARLNELERNLAMLSAEYKNTYPDIIQTKEEIEQLKKKLQAKYDDGLDKQGEVPKQATHLKEELGPRRVFDPYLRELIRQRNEVKIEIATVSDRRARLRAQMKNIESRVEQIPSREQELLVLVRDYENMQGNYQSLLDKKLNARVAQNLEKRQKGEQFRILDPANLPEKPARPNQLRIMLMGLAAGCALGFGTVILLEQIQSVFRRTEEVENALRLPVLAAIPLLNASLLMTATDHPFNRSQASRLSMIFSRQKGAVQSGSRDERQGHGWHSRVFEKMWHGADRGGPYAADQLSHEMNFITKWRPWSVISEQFRVAATRMMLLAASRANTIVIVTSALKGEGKSFVAVNLAYVLARNLGKSTLLVDCDLKCPMVHRYIGIDPAVGLSQVLSIGEEVGHCIYQIEGAPLSVLPAGQAEDHPVELSKMHQLNGILEKLRPEYDYIILDAPPILPLADMHVLARLADLITMVVRAGVTRQTLVRKALNTLRPQNEPCVILNGLLGDAIPSYMQDDYDYFSPKKELARLPGAISPMPDRRP